MNTSSAVAVETKRRTCLLVAPPGTDLGAIRRLLGDKGVESFVPSDVPPVGVTVLDQLGKALSRADSIIFVLTASHTDANVSFEIGLALGRGKKLMVLAPDDGKDVPADMRELLVVRARLNDDEAIGFSLDQLLAAPRSNGGRATASPPGGQPLGDVADPLIRRAESLRDRVARRAVGVPDEQEFEQIVVAALEASRVSPVVAAQGRGDAAGLAVWVEELDSLGLNPLLIELKPGLDGPDAIDAAVGQARAYLRSFRARAVLILSLSGRPAEGGAAPPLPNSVFFLDLVDLLGRMKTRSFGDVLRAIVYDGASALSG